MGCALFLKRPGPDFCGSVAGPFLGTQRFDLDSLAPLTGYSHLRTGVSPMGTQWRPESLYLSPGSKWGPLGMVGTLGARVPACCPRTRRSDSPGGPHADLLPGGGTQACSPCALRLWALACGSTWGTEAACCRGMGCCERL